jgi:hypothetical protein
LSPLAALGLFLVAATPAFAHHVGAYVPKDNAITANFKQIKFSVQAGKFDVAHRLFETGALRSDMRARAASLPPRLEAGLRDALQRRDGDEVERRLMVFFAALARDLALEAERRMADPTLSRDARTAIGQRFLEAIWRYYNLVDFAVAQRDDKTSVAVRLAFDEAEGYVKTSPIPNPDTLREPLRRIAQVLSAFIDSSLPARRSS